MLNSKVHKDREFIGITHEINNLIFFAVNNKIYRNPIYSKHLNLSMV